MKTILQNAKHFIWNIKYNDNSEKNVMNLLTLHIVIFSIAEDLLIPFKKNTDILSKAHR